MYRSHPPPGFQQYSQQPIASPSSFRFRYYPTPGIDHILSRQVACRKPVDIAWLLNAPTYQDSIPVRTLDLDSAQDLLLLVHYDQPHHPNAKGIIVFPVHLSDPVKPHSHGMTNAHPYARNMAIAERWGEGDYPDGGQQDSIAVEISICGDHYALFVRYAFNERVVIYNWKTGQRLARIDSEEIHTDAAFSNAVIHPLDIHQFAWLSPEAFMVGSVDAESKHAGSLYVYMLSGHPRHPLARSMMLELPRWKPCLRHLANERRLNFVSGSWSEDIYPGAVSSNRDRHVTVVEDMCRLGDGSGYNVFYAIRNDVLLWFLRNQWGTVGKIVSWDQWSKISACVFEGVPRHSASQHMDIQVCGQKVMMVTTDRAQGATHVEVADFDVQIPGLTNPNEPSREGSGKPHRKCYARSDFFEKGHVGTSRWGPRSIVVPANMGWGTQLILGSDHIFLSRTRNDWKDVGYISLQASLPQQVAGYVASGAYRR